MVEKTTSYYSYELSNTFCGKTPSPKTELDVCLTFFHSTWSLPHQKTHHMCCEQPLLASHIKGKTKGNFL